ncbi:MAG: FG-GAP-like repeat-containing protein [Myxococcales bacterium]
MAGTLAVMSGCAVEVGSEDELEVNGISQPFAVTDWMVASNASLLRWAQTSAGGVKVCLQGTGFTAANTADYQNAAKAAIVAWVDGIRPISKASLITAANVSFSCNNPQVTLNWDINNTDSATGQPGWIELGGQGSGVLLHEFGHVFGLDDTYLNNVLTCKEAHESSVMCHGSQLSALAADDIDGIQRAFCTVYPAQCKARWNASISFCSGTGKQLRTGEFTGDGRTDLLCHDTVAGTRQVLWADKNDQFPSVSWNDTYVWCQAPKTLQLGDYNGDGRTDYLCHDGTTGNDSITYTNQWGYYLTPTAFTLTNCSGNGRYLADVGDFNGDGRTDLLCRWSDGTVLTQQATTNGTFTGVSWVGTWAALCSSSGRLLAGDVNRDGRDDLVCKETTSGTLRVGLASSTGTFSSISSTATLSFCTQPSSVMALADFDGDGRDDFYCRDIHDNYGGPATTGGHWIALAQSDATFKGISRYWTSFNDATTTQVALGDFDRNGGTDLAFTTSAGALSVDYTELRFSQVASGESHSCALNANGQARCWGDNELLTLEVPRGGRYSALVLGADFSCGLRSSDSKPACWGNGPTASVAPATAFTKLSAAAFHVCGIKASDSSIACWAGSNAPPQGMAPASVAGTFTAVAAGGAHSCGITGGNAKCWGLNDKGQAPASVTGPFQMIAAGDQFTCARKTDKIQCWGNNTSGQAPASVTGSFLHLTAGSAHACAQRQDGTVQCWGANSVGQTTVPSDKFVANQVYARGEHTCGILASDQSLKCWGNNTDGESTPAR